MGGSWPKNPTVTETFRQAPLKAKGEVQPLATVSEEPQEVTQSRVSVWW